MVLSLVFVRSYNFGWSPVYDCKAYLETNTVKNCSYFGFGGYFLVAGTSCTRLSEIYLKPFTALSNCIYFRYSKFPPLTLTQYRK